MVAQTDQELRAILHGFEGSGLTCEEPVVRVAIDRATGWLTMRGESAPEGVRINEDWFLNADGRPFTREAILAELCRLYKLLPTLPTRG